MKITINIEAVGATAQVVREPSDKAWQGDGATPDRREESAVQLLLHELTGGVTLLGRKDEALAFRIDGVPCRT